MLPPTPLARKPAQPFETAEPAVPITRCAELGMRCENVEGAIDATLADDSERGSEVEPEAAALALVVDDVDDD